ncbi:MAG: RdgB/HAM1 family non-canonical purine NTP pyrophosphatase [Burkholderiaceae bacterium]
MVRTIVLASNNQGKLAEFSGMLEPLGFAVHPQAQYGVPEAEEPYPTFIENALTKARHAAQATGLPALADDSGICVAALGNAPGVLSARYAGEPKSDAANNRKLVDALALHADKSAYYYCVLVYVRHALDPQPIVAEARWDGEIVAVPRGEGGFGYDAHFLIPSTGRTVAELGAAEKNRLSHRGQALRLLVRRLGEEVR